ncbi:MAG: hypothetical protein H7X91_01120, partial [Burkholderiales bacterium]|nr:hypothetical protein [Burkholderiales bacterium]
LFAPPFDKTPRDPGYIKSYPPGVRENGGQYTHGSLWLPMAFARLGDGDKASALLQMMSPVEHARTPADVAHYKVEPYAVAADVYALAGKIGQGGWTWYTGSAGWMYRIWIEEVLGFKLAGDRLSIDPVISSQWPGFSLRYRYRETDYEIVIENPQRICRGVASIRLDGRLLRGESIKLIDDRARHTLIIQMGLRVSKKSVES